MEALKTTKKKNYLKRRNSLPPLKFKKFWMNMDKTGVNILISASFLKKSNHSLRIQNGILHLKIEQSAGPVGHANGSTAHEVQKKYMGFQIRLPHKKYRHINSVRFHNGSLQIHLSERQVIRRGFRNVKPSTIPHQLTSTIRH